MITMEADNFYFRPTRIGEPQRIYLRLEPVTGHAALEEELRKAGAEPLPQDEYHSARSLPDYAVIAVTAGPGIWLALRAAIRGLAERHRHKGFILELSGGHTMSADGHSAKEVARLLVAAEQLLQCQNRTQDQHFDAVDRVARQLLAHRADLVIPEPWGALISVDSSLDGAAALLDDCRTTRQRHALVGFLAEVVRSNGNLEDMAGQSVATTTEAQQALAAVADVIRGLPRGIFENGS
ncbi:hypothetical protein [Streptomyces incarnatus]|uniref:hypothetical protein n=1 Tax=Streptomyces incarnatus TaxID=665007 RepID=UPI001AD845F2|nr:hypothetical protein [Streptomyces incarnatus]